MWLTFLLIVITYMLYIRWSDKNILPVLSSFMINIERNYLTNISGILVLKNKIAFDEYFKLLVERLSKLKQFTHKVNRPYYFGFPRFEEYPIKYEEHIHYIKNEEKVQTKEDLEKKIAEISHIPLDPSKPLWEAYLFDNYLYNGKDTSSVVYIRFHHCIADGSSSLLLLLYLLNEKSIKKDLVPKKRDKKQSSKGVIHFVKDIFTSSKNLLLPVDDTPNIFQNVPNEACPDIQLSVTNNIFDVDELKKISHKFNESTINDLLMSSVYGTIRAYIDKYSTKEGSYLLETRPIFKFGMWVNMRRINWFDSKPTEIPILTNDIGAMMFTLDMDKDPSNRITKVSNQIKELLNTIEPYLCKLIFKVLGLLPPILLAPIWKLLISKLTVSFSNVPGPQYPLEMCGSEIDSISFFVNPTLTCGTMICIVSYYGKISSTVCSFNHIIPFEINNLLIKDINHLKSIYNLKTQ